MEIFFNYISYILAIFGIYQIITFFIKLFRESIWLSLSKPERIFQWQHIQIAKAAYLSAKKFRRLNKKLQRKNKANVVLINKTDKILKEIVNTRKIMYNNVKQHGVNTVEFKALAKNADNLYSEYIQMLNT